MVGSLALADAPAGSDSKVPEFADAPLPSTGPVASPERVGAEKKASGPGAIGGSTVAVNAILPPMKLPAKLGATPPRKAKGEAAAPRLDDGKVGDAGDPASCALGAAGDGPPSGLQPASTHQAVIADANQLDPAQVAEAVALV